MRIRGRVRGYTLESSPDYMEIYALGHHTADLVGGPTRRIMRLEIEVMAIEGQMSRQDGYCDINIISPGDTIPDPVVTQAPPARAVNANRAAENIRNLAQALAAGGYEAELMTATGADLNRIAEDVGLTRRMEQETDAELRRRAENAMFSTPEVLSRVQASMAAGTVRRGGSSPIEEGPGPVKPEPPKPEEPKEPTRWSMLEID